MNPCGSNNHSNGIFWVRKRLREENCHDTKPVLGALLFLKFGEKINLIICLCYWVFFLTWCSILCNQREKVKRRFWKPIRVFTQLWREYIWWAWKSKSMVEIIWRSSRYVQPINCEIIGLMDGSLKRRSLFWKVWRWWRFDTKESSGKCATSAEGKS